MTDIFTDADIQRLLSEPKALPATFDEQLRLKPKRGHKEAELKITGRNGSTFRLILRQSNLDPLDFSVIVGYEIPHTNLLFRLRRYNGNSHWHTNKIERTTITGYHIHQATQRYQEIGLSEDSYAEATERYANIANAVQCALNDCNFDLPINSQLPLL